MHRCPPMHGCPPQETTHWKSVAPSKWISMHRLCAPRVAYLMVRPCIAVPHEKPHIPSLSRLSNACRWVGSMPLGLFTMCLAWVSTCSLCFERGDSCTWGTMHRCPPMHGYPPQETTHWKSVAPSKWISMRRLCATRVTYLMGSIR